MTALFSALVGSVARGGRAALPSVGSLRVAVAPYMIDTFPYTGSVRPGKQSPMRKIPSTILRPDYADDGRPKAKGSLLPWQVEVKTAEDIEGMRIAGRVAREVLDAAGRMVAPGMTTDAIDELVTRETIARGAYPSPLNYHNFPKSCCTSINEVICHGIPDSTVLKDGDIVNIDITCYIGGYHGDCSETFLVGNVDEAGRQLVKVTHDCWQAAIEYCKPGQPFSGIGKIIEDFVKPYGYSSNRDFCGHGIGKVFHTSPNILHVRNSEPGRMQVGNVFTIEPMICEGTSQHVMWNDQWTATTRDGKRSAQFEHTLLITETGVEAFTGRLPTSNPFFWELDGKPSYTGVQGSAPVSSTVSAAVSSAAPDQAAGSAAAPARPPSATKSAARGFSTQAAPKKKPKK